VNRLSSGLLARLLSRLAICLPLALLATSVFGADTGYVVLSLGGIKPLRCSTISLPWQNTDPAAWYTDDERKNRARRTSSPLPPPPLSFGYRPESLFVNAPRDFEDGAMHGRVIAKELPVGRYIITHFFCTNVYGRPAIMTFDAPKELSIPFDVRKDEIAYIGQFLVGPVYAKNFLGIRAARDIYLYVSDQSERDLPWVREHEAALTSMAANIQVFVPPPDLQEVRTSMLPPSND